MDIPDEYLQDFRKALKNLRERGENIFSVDTPEKVRKTTPEMHSNVDTVSNRGVRKTQELGENLREVERSSENLPGNAMRILSGNLDAYEVAEEKWQPVAVNI